MSIKVLPWTWTKLAAFETCGFQHLKRDLQKVFKDEGSEALDWGNKTHSAFETAIKKNKPLPDEFGPWQKWIDAFMRTPGEKIAEQKYALLKDLRPCEYFAPGAWYRGKADAVAINGKVALAIDWKTGKRKDPKATNNMQLALMAQCVFAYHPEVQAVQSRFVWLESDQEDTEVFRRSDIAKVWVENLLPRVNAMLEAARTETYLPKPSGLCVKYCPVMSCSFHGRGSK